MRTPRLRIAAHQHFILGIEKDHARGQHCPDALQNIGKQVERLPLADIHDNGGAFDLRGLAHQVGKIRQQFQRQIIHGMKPKIFKCL